MKKLTASCAILLGSLFAFSQDSLNFTMGLQPGHRYEQTMLQKMNLTISYDSSSASVMSELKNKGVKNPTIQQMESDMEAVFSTGGMKAGETSFPVTLSIVKNERNNQPVLAPGTAFFGKATLNHLPVYDSLSVTTVNEQQKLQMLNMINGLASQFNLSGKKMLVGDTYTSSTPIHFPIGGTNLNMNMIVAYHLIAIHGSAALFDEKVSIQFDMDIKDLPITGSGSGGGSMVYDIAHHYVQSNDLKYQMQFRVAKDGLIMHMRINDGVKIACRIQ